MVAMNLRQSPTPTWAYAYQIAPPQTADRLRPIATLLAYENQIARREARIWTAKVVLEQHVTHILVVSDDPEQDRKANRRLELALEDLQAAFSITLPMAVDDDGAGEPDPGHPSGDSDEHR